MTLTTLAFAHEALDGLARSAGWPSAAEALVDLTTEPLEPYGPRDGAVLVGTWKDVLFGEDAETWADRGMMLAHRPSAPMPNREYNLTRAKHPMTERIRALRLAGLSNREQAGVLNRQEGTEYWTSERVRSIAHQQGLTRVRLKPGNGRRARDPEEVRRLRNERLRQLRADAKEYRRVR